jgi:hypothetical protein
MDRPPPPAGREQRLLRNARREGLLILSAWAVALVWTTVGGWFGGYRRDPAAMGTVLGIPDWVFWCVVLPWGVCVVFAVWFCFGFMADDDLGRDRDEGEHHA